jgi:hypothetical protein
MEDKNTFVFCLRFALWQIISLSTLLSSHDMHLNPEHAEYFKWTCPTSIFWDCPLSSFKLSGWPGSVLVAKVSVPAL